MSYLLATPYGYYFRIAVPKALRDVMQKREIKRPLHTQNRLQAIRLSAMYAAQCHQIFNDLLRNSVSQKINFTNIEIQPTEILPNGTLRLGGVKSDPRFPIEEREMLSHYIQQVQQLAASMKNTPSPQITTEQPIQQPVLASTQVAAPIAVSTGTALIVPSTAKRLSHYIAEYIEEKFIISTDVTQAYKDAVANELEFMIELIGDIPVEELSRDKALKMFLQLQKLPANFKRRYPGKTVAQLITMKLPPRSGRTVNSTMAVASKFCEWLALKKLANTDFFVNLRSTDTSTGRVFYEPEDLALIFSHSTFTVHEFNYHYQYFVCLLALTTGARLNEICQLRVSDITTEYGKVILNITDDEETKAKNENSIRRVPLHPKMVELGFLEYVNSRKGQHLLFDGLRLDDKTGRRSPNASAWYTRFKRSLRFTERGKDFHSFRHTVIHELINSTVEHRLIKAIVGHADALSKEVLKTDMTFDVYGKMHFYAPKLYDAVCILNFDHILKNVVPWNTNIVPVKRIADFISDERYNATVERAEKLIQTMPAQFSKENAPKEFDYHAALAHHHALTTP